MRSIMQISILLLLRIFVRERIGNMEQANANIMDVAKKGNNLREDTKKKRNRKPMPSAKYMHESRTAKNKFGS